MDSIIKVKHFRNTKHIKCSHELLSFVQIVKLHVFLFHIHRYIQTYLILGSCVNTPIISLFYFAKSMLNLIEIFIKNSDMFNLCNGFWNFWNLFQRFGYNVDFDFKQIQMELSQFSCILIHFIFAHVWLKSIPVIHTSANSWKNCYSGHDLLLKLVFIKIYVFRYWNSFQFSFSFVCLVYLNNIHP